MHGLNFIGEWQESISAARFEREDPARTSRVVASFPESTVEDVDRAVRSVVDAPDTWGRLNPHHRKTVLERAAEILRDRSDRIGADLAAEEGKPVSEARGEVLRAADVFSYVAGSAQREQGRVFASSRPTVTLMTCRRPLGVVAAITPFNFPAFVSSFKIAGALMAGNGVVWKPSPLTPMTGAHVVQALLDAGLPTDVLAYLTGTSAELGESLIAHPRVDAISFTGSTHVGGLVEVAAARHGKRAQVEKGGNNPLIAAADASPDAVVDAVFDGAFGGTGQKCTATSRLIIAREIAETVTARLRDRIASIVIGSPEDPSTFMGPIVSASARDAFEHALQGAESAGAEVFRGGKLPGGDDGYYVQPSIVCGVDAMADIARDEVFGPVVVVLPYDTFDEAIEIANGTPFGLSAGLYSNSLSTTAQFIDRVRAGMLNINVPTTGVEPHVPFGGLKSSGSGPKELGDGVLDFFSVEITVATGTH